jgi:hypothetical protein
MLNDLDSHELTEWMAFYQIENERAANKNAGNTSGDVNADIKAKMGFYGR